MGNQAYKRLKDKYGSEKAQQLSQLAKGLLGFKQGALPPSDYLTDMIIEKKSDSDREGGRQ